jgi:hypothetical protein
VAEAALGATLLALLERLRLPSATWRAGRVLVAGGDLDQPGDRLRADFFPCADLRNEHSTMSLTP